MKRLPILLCLTALALSIMPAAAIAADKNKVVFKNLGGETVTSLFNPKELVVQKRVPWKASAKVGSTTPTVGCDYVIASAGPQPGLTILSPNPQIVGPLGPNASTTIDWEMMVDTDAVTNIDFAVEVGWGGGETSSAVMSMGIKVAGAPYLIDIAGPTGGTVAAGDLTVDVAPGSFSGTYTFGALEETPPADPAPAGLAAASTVYYVSPGGLEFTPGQEATVTLKYDPAADPNGLDVYSYDPDTGWQKETLNKTFAPGYQLSVKVMHFSYFAVFGPAPPTGLNSYNLVLLALVSLSLGTLLVRKKAQI